MRNWGISQHATWKRDGACAVNQHNCLDTGHGDQCCNDDSYCYVGAGGESRCCPLGSNCVADSPCNSKSYYCAGTATASALPSSSVAANATEMGCCKRPCPDKYFLCPADLGGNCCPFGSSCRPDGNCVAAAPTTMAAPTSTSSITACSSSGVCTSTSPADPSAGGVSASTKTGIAVTVVAAVGVIAGVLAWLWMLRKRFKARTAAAREQATVSEVPGDRSFGSVTAARSSNDRVVLLHLDTCAGDAASPVELDSAVPGDDAEGDQPKPEGTEVYELGATEIRFRASEETATLGQEGTI